MFISLPKRQHTDTRTKGLHLYNTNHPPKKGLQSYPTLSLFTTTKQRMFMVIDFLIFCLMTRVWAFGQPIEALRSRRYDKTAQTSRPIRSLTATWPNTVHLTWHAWKPMNPLKLNEESKFQRQQRWMQRHDPDLNRQQALRKQTASS